MQLLVLGVNSPYPRGGHATLGYLVEHGGTHLLIETGFGIYRRLDEAGLLAQVDGIVLSHLHCDHCADLPAIVLGATVGRGRTDAIPVFLPPGEAERLDRWLTACGFTFVLEYAALSELNHGTPAAFRHLELTMHPAAHSLPAGILTVSSGGKRLGYTGDTGDCPALREALRGADLALAEVAGLGPAEAAKKGHLPATLLGAVAKEAGVHELVVTHFMQGSDPEALTAEVAAAFGRPVLTAREGLRIQI